LERAIPRLEKEAKRNAKDKGAQEALEAARNAQNVLNGGTSLIHAERVNTDALRELNLLTVKPFIYVFNLDTDELGDEALRAKLQELVAPAEAIFLDAKIEAELAELDDDEAAELLEALGQDERSEERRVGKECRARMTRALVEVKTPQI